MNARKWMMVSGLIGMTLLGLSLYFNPLSLPISLAVAVTGSQPILYALFGGAILLAAKYVKGIVSR